MIPTGLAVLRLLIAGPLTVPEICGATKGDLASGPVRIALWNMEREGLVDGSVPSEPGGPATNPRYRITERGLAAPGVRS